MNIVERCGDKYRVWSTVSDEYIHDASMTREDMFTELVSWGWTPENANRRLDEAEVVTQWAMGALESDAELLGCAPEEVRYWGDK